MNIFLFKYYKQYLFIFLYYLLYINSTLDVSNQNKSNSSEEGWWVLEQTEHFPFIDTINSGEIWIRKINIDKSKIHTCYENKYQSVLQILFVIQQLFSQA
jgi:hypothetical protein